MVMRYPKIDNSGGPAEGEKAAELRAGTDKDDACRCKAASEMSPGELFKLMVGDLAFWKKTKKE